MSISRKELFSGNLSRHRQPLRPPWAIAEPAFITVCNNCNSCIEKCPTHLLKSGRGKYPVADFNSGECTFCGECVNACDTGALRRMDPRQPWLLKAHISNERCIAYQNIECRSCYDPCETKAIKFNPNIGSVSKPELQPSLCTGCGACYQTCPTQAITMKHKSPELI